MTVRVTAVVVVGLVAVTGVPGPGWPQASSAGFQRLWYQAYDDGVRAVQRAYSYSDKQKTLSFLPQDGVDFKPAIANLEAASRSGPAPGRRVLFQGDRVDVFNPDYYLGLAYYGEGRFADAEAAFARVANDKLLVAGDPEFSTFRRRSAFATYERMLADGERALSGGRYADVEKMWNDIVSGPSGIADDDNLDERANDLRERAKSEAAKAAVANVDPVKPPVSQPNVDDQVTPPPNLPEVNPRPLEPPGTGGIVPPPRGVPVNPVSAPMNLQEITRQGATAYFEGSYEDASRILSPTLALQQPPALAAFYFACSRAALVASGRADSASLDEARRTFAYARASGDLSRHLRYISPRVREMLGDVPATAR